MSTVIYARVSTETQEKHQTIDSQLAELRRYAEIHGLFLGREFVDDGYSGSLLERPALDALRDAIAGGGIEAVLCLCPDRLSRNFVHLGLLLEEFGKRGVRVVFANQQIDDSPEGKLLLQIQGAVAEYERTKIVDRCRRGMLHRAREGHVIGGCAPYGYTYVHRQPGQPARWEINEEEAAVVREIYRLFVDERLSLGAIIAELQARGIRSQSGRERWSRSLVHSIVSRETYTGTAYMFKHYATEPQRGRERGDYRRVRNSSRRQRQREDWIPVPVPAIIPREVWERARERRAENQRLALRNTKRQYLLRGLVRCAACGQSWRGQCNTGYLYYCCGGKRGDGRPKGERCRAKAVRVDRLEPVVWDTVRGLLESPELLVAEYRKELARRQAAAETVGKHREETERRIQSLADEEMRVVRLYREGKIGRGVLEGQLEEIQRRRSELEKELAHLRRADSARSAEALEAGV